MLNPVRLVLGLLACIVAISKGANPCQDYSLHDCDAVAECVSEQPGYFQCHCPRGYFDASPDKRYPGRKCVRETYDTHVSYHRDSRRISSTRDDRRSFGVLTNSARVEEERGQIVRRRSHYEESRIVPKHISSFPAIDECSLGTHNCDAHADCIDTNEGYTCRCRAGYQESSPDPLRSPGRSCRPSQRSQCSHADCAPEAECRESPSGPVCQCVSGYVDISRQHGRPTGRVCRAVVNECATRQHDCSSHATCIDTAESFTCRCNEGFRDESPSASSRPGRVCVRAYTPEPPECEVADPMSCDQHKQEVCVFVNSTYKCRCAAGRSRLPDGRCLVINECADPRLNDCGKNSECIDQAEGFTCQCRSGYADASPAGLTGRVCKARINECANKQRYEVDCSENAICVDREDGYSCQCRPGFADVSASYNRLPGRRCIEAINECMDPTLNDCSKNAICEDAKESYICTCRAGYVDASPSPKIYPGRVCMKPIDRIHVKKMTADTGLQLDGCDPKAPNCQNNEICTDRSRKGHHVCECMDNAFRYSDGTCKLYSACSRQNDCDSNAFWNSLDFHRLFFRCQCRPGYLDVSPDADNNPGKKCQELINECATSDNECSVYAKCIDTAHGYECQCLDGYVDVSSKYGFAPGRKCTNTINECQDIKLNSCDENADCVDTPDGYTCQCFSGFVDVSSSASLPPGRVCTVQTTCPKQKTDLIFLIDGSGSIGSYVFKNEVLRFVKEFVDLFEIAPDRTRVGLIQYSDQIRHEFDLNQYPDKVSLLRAIGETQYLTGLTRTGAAIQHMVREGFSERRGARRQADDISRVAIILTDGRSQDNVTRPAIEARDLKINTFAIGVTDHVLASELESIAGSPQRWFYVNRFKDLDTRLRSLIQKVACPSVQLPTRGANPGPCNPRTQTGCDRSLNELCVQHGSVTSCECPEGFERHPVTKMCGGSLCNPQLTTSCVFPEQCEITPYHNHRCRCPVGYRRDFRSGFCVSIQEIRLFANDADCHNGGEPCGQHEVCTRDRTNHYYCECETGYERSPHTRKCVYPGECNPLDNYSCDVRKREVCLNNGARFSCQCAHGEKRHAITGICLKNECQTGENDCDRSARCVDTDEGDGYFCACPNGFIDRSPDVVNKPGRLCVAEQNECTDGSNRCSPNALCTDTEEGYICRCKPGFVDYSPNIHSFPGLICKELVNECSSPSLNNCDRNAICIDTQESYTCLCKAGFQDMDEFRNPGRLCKPNPQNDRCSAGKNSCDRNAICSQIGENDYSCSCPPGFKDKSPSPSAQPGRVCIPVIPECDNPALNDCDSPDRAICTDTDEGFLCRCRQGFLDISPSIAVKPGRLCKPLQNECALGIDDCARDGAICEDTPDSYTCRCAMNYLDVSFDRQNRPGRKCKRLVDECATGQNDCSSEALCTDTEDSYICACPATHIDVSPDTQNRPGRRCLLRLNECTTSRHDCSPNADCVDTPESYSCRCRDDFVDESPDRTHRPGRICRPALVDECRLGQHDCHQDAVCHDLPQGFNCQCRPEFLDESPRRTTHPGRLCRPRPTPPPDECRIDSLRDCSQERREVCRLVNGIPKCTCADDFTRDASGACTVVNECLVPQLNDCHTSAECIDQLVGYTCRCKAGFKDISSRDKPGRICAPMVNECEYPHLNDCHQNAQCIDLEEGYDCKCHQGFRDKSIGRPGRICKRMVNECLDSKLNSCDKNAECIDEEDGYRCQCRADFYDVSPSPALKGRACRAIVNECIDGKLNDCDRNARCTDTLDSYECECPPQSRDISPSPAFPGRVCLLFENECESGKHDCDANAICHDNEQSFTCECPRGFVDRSPNKLTRSGRVCIRLVDECRENRHTCSAQADCRDLEEGYTCECKEGYIDRSPNIQLQPGRVCGTPDVCPPNHECSSAAVCEPLGGNKYKCTCIQGYVDQSPPGQAGRICIRNNACRDPTLNQCSKNAICYDELRGYRCECARGYIDHSPNPSEPGRICEAPAPPPPQRQFIFDQPEPWPSQRSTRTQVFTHFDSTPRIRYHEVPSPRYHGVQIDYREFPTTPRTPPQVFHIHERVEQSRVQFEDVPVNTRRVIEETRHYQEIPTQQHKIPATQVLRVDDNFPFPRTRKVEERYQDVDQQIHIFPTPPPSPPPPPPRVIHIHEERRFENPLPPPPPTQRIVHIHEERHRYEQEPAPPPPRRIVHIHEERINFRSHAAPPAQPDVVIRHEPPAPPFHGDKLEPFNWSPAPPAPQPRHPCQDPELNDCHPAGTCRTTGATSYTCECLQGYADRSPDRANKPGRLCVLTQPACLDPTQNDCHPAAICSEVSGPEKYTCRCRDGYTDQSPSRSHPGRLCVEQVNECLDRSLNDCDPSAICENMPEGFTCRCPVGTQDRSPDPSRPGRKCYKTVNECRSPLLNNCSRFADCEDREDGFNCQCKDGYHDDDVAHPGTRCTYIINECESSNLNDCDRNAECIDTPGGYECRCKNPYRDESPRGQPGRLCRLNECTNPALNNCDKNAECHDTDEGYYCVCRTGFYDDSPNPREPGRICVAFQQEQTRRIEIVEDAPRKLTGLQCGRYECSIERNEVCIGGVECGCRPGESRSSPTARCQKVEVIPFQIRVVSRDNRPLMYSSEYGNTDSPTYIEIVDRFQKDVARTFGGTAYAPRFVNTHVNYITHPRTVNSSWPDGLLFKFEVQTTAVGEPIDNCELWKQMQGSLQRSNGAIGGGSLRVASDSELLNPCRVEELDVATCGGEKCKEEYGEICIAGHVCGCPPGMKRANKESACRAVESWSVPILVARQGTKNLVFDARVHSNPQAPIHKELVHRFEEGVSDCYPHTEVRSAFVSAEVNDIVEPSAVNATWDSGLLFNATMHFRRGAVREPSDVYYSLIKYIQEKNGGEIGDSELYLTPYQPDPFKACYKNTCHSSGKCIDVGPHQYRCECGPGFRDMEPTNPGHKCLPTTGFNECEREETNECSVNARCIDLPHLYKCECLPSYADASPPGAIPGSICNLDYCSDVDYCPQNSTCKNMELQAECTCDAGYMDIRRSEKRAQLGMPESLCMHTRDVNECALGLTNCSGVAECTDRPIGYTCRCPDGYIDGNLDEPGRVCGALLCDLCNSHGDCVHNAQTNNITCVCTDGWSGEFCEAAPSNANLVLLIILALLFLLLALCCLLYMCTRCHCFKGGRAMGAGAFGYRNSAWPWATLDGSSSSESGEHSHSSVHAQEYYPDIGIPRAKLAKGAEGYATSAAAHKSTEVARLDEYLDSSAMHIPRARLAGAGAAGGLNESFDSASSTGSEYTIKEEVERRVITDVNVKEIKTTTTTDADGNTVTTTAEYYHPQGDGSTHVTSTAGARSSYGAESSSHYAAAHESSASSSALHSSSMAQSESASALASSASRFAAGGTTSRGAYVNHAARLADEQERGESIAEFSIGRAEGRRSAGQHHHFSENREISEYTDEASMYSSEEEEVEHEKGDKKTRVERQHSFEPLPGGDRERFRTEVTTTKTSTSTTKH
ncbi:unnamed protein product, partial [Mesorhabditis spiculigera]